MLGVRAVLYLSIFGKLVLSTFPVSVTYVYRDDMFDPMPSKAIFFPSIFD